MRMKNFPNSTPNSFPRTVELDIKYLVEKIEDKRVQLGITEREVSRRIGEKTSATYTRLKNGRQPSTDLFIRILLWLGTTNFSDFLKEIE